MGTLYVVGTPIGNLEDITLRALRVLKEVDLIAAEDTRKTMRLLSHFDIHTPQESYHRHSGTPKLERLLELLQTKDVALVSEAGMPGISDPGEPLIAAALEQGVPVIPIPGPTAMATALVVSGLPSDRFLFLGFLSRVRSDRQRFLRSVAALPFTLVLYEAPHRLLATLADLETVLGDRPAAAARELTKLHEEVVRGRISEIALVFKERAPRGEFTLVIAPPREGEVSSEQAAQPAVDLVAAARRLRAEGVEGKDGVKRLMESTGSGRRAAYQAWLESGK
ncbi:MAG TPA: 16S rRNA (cytidine(1402)-2'-O)-methyltransferase [Chloroflexota bacterium]|nr:16S rRNA (cytidine(1402)-2'-O)-methyltransferase [Chloroflexota bacterium]